MDQLMNEYDVVVVGGGAAGLSGALTLARARRSVVVIDAGTPRNAPAAGVHGFLSRDGVHPAELLEIGRAEVGSYSGRVVEGEVSAVTRNGAGFTVTLTDERTVGARRLLVTTGLVDELPDVAGIRERWGRDVHHCPYCHGWEIRDQSIGVLASGPLAVHQALLFRQWSADITLFLHTTPPLGEEEAEQLAARGISVVPGEVESLEIADDRFAGVRLRGGTLIRRQALVVMPRFMARADVLATLGLKPTAHPLGMGEYIAADATGLTTVPGVWVAGNVTDLMAQVTGAAASGVTAAAAINADLIAEDIRQAVTGYRDSRLKRASHPHHHGEGSAVPEQFDQAFWDELYSSHSSLWSGNPNRHLIGEASQLTPGTALDVGCGEGADAIWLAQRGWKVTAVDLSTVALQRAAAHAAQAGTEIAGHIDWRHADLTAWDPGAARYDLVSAQYMQLLPGPRETLFRRLAASVRPGGSLLIVGHHPSDQQTTMPRPHLPELYFTGDDIIAYLDAGQWEVISNTAAPRPVTDPEGRAVTIHDTVLRARRHS